MVQKSNTIAAHKCVAHGQVEDCLAFSTLVRWRHPPSLPAFIGGQSMGGLVSLHVALADQSLWRGILLCSAAVDIEWTPLLRYSTICTLKCMPCRQTFARPLIVWLEGTNVAKDKSPPFPPPASSSSPSHDCSSIASCHADHDLAAWAESSGIWTMTRQMRCMPTSPSLGKLGS